MNRTELIKIVSHATGFSERTVETIIAAYESGVQDAIESDGKFISRGFGTFVLVDKAKRNVGFGGERKESAEGTKVVFRASWKK